MSSSQLAIVQTYTVQTNGNSTATKGKKPSHISQSISAYCDNTSANYSNIFAYLRIMYNTSGACLNLPEYVEALHYSTENVIMQSNMLLKNICTWDCLNVVTKYHDIDALVRYC